MAYRCQLTGKKNNVANSVSFSVRRTKRLQKVNLIKKRFFIPSKKRWITLRVSTSAVRSIEKMGVEAFLKKCGVAV